MLYSLEYCLAKVVLAEHATVCAKRAAYMRQWNLRNRERVIEQRKKSRLLRHPIILVQKKAHYEKHKASILAYQKQYRAANPEKLSARDKAYRERDPELTRAKKRDEYQRHRAIYRASQAAWRKNNPNWQREWAEKNKEHIRATVMVSRKKHFAKNPSAKAAANMRSRVWALLKKIGAEKSISLGLQAQALKSHLESKFQAGMTWDNYGTTWVVDHIIPCAAWDLSKPIQLRQCFHYFNLQPLFRPENAKKSAKLMRQSEFSLA